MKHLKTLAFVLVTLLLCSATTVRGADPWKEQPIAQAFARSIATTIGEYEWWAEEWRRDKRSPTDSDRTINLMAETTFIAIKLALEAHPNPPLLERCLIFLGTVVPPEFDDLWRATILEMADVHHATSRKVNEVLKSKRLPSLEERAMSRKSPTNEHEAPSSK